MKPLTAAPVDSLFARFDKWLWQAENAGPTFITRSLWHSARVLFAVMRDLFAGNITLHAMGLVYTTLLSIVPFLALSFSLLKAFGVHNLLQPTLEAWTAALGDKGPEITTSIIGFVDNFNVGVLSSLGLGLLIYTVISLVQKVEHSFNEVWRVSQLRSLSQRFSNYLSVIIVGPLLVFSAMGATATLMASDLVSSVIAIGPFGWIYSLLSRVTPYLMIIGLFTFLYIFIPNTKVRLKYAFIGGLVAGVLWQSVGILFAKIVAMSANYSSYAAIYSGFAVGIISLWWLYISWLILLIGSSISFYAQHSQQITRSRHPIANAEVDELTGLAMVYLVAKNFDCKGGGVDAAAMESKLSVGPQVIVRIRQKLLDHKILLVAGTNCDLLLPGRALDKITLAEVLHALRCTESPLPMSLTKEPAVMQIAQRLKTAQETELAALTLAEWVRNDGCVPASNEK